MLGVGVSGSGFTSCPVFSWQSHRFSYDEPMLVESVTQSLCDLALKFGEGDDDSMVCPFSFLVALLLFPFLLLLLLLLLLPFILLLLLL